MVGKKRSKSRITIALTCNASGSDKLPPLIIHTAENPRALQRVNKQSLGCQYYWNQKAWMNTPIMCDYLAFMDRHCASRKCILLMDNFSPHASGQEWLLENEGGLKNLTVRFFPANVTSLYQPLDQGIIRSCKAQYHRLFLRYCIDRWSIAQDPIKDINIRHAIQWVVEAWNVGVSIETIQHCWKHSTCINLLGIPESTVPESTGEAELIAELDTVARGVISLEDLLNPIDEIVGNEVEDVEELIVQAYNNLKIDVEVESEEEDSQEPRIGHSEGLELLDRLIKYEEQQEDINLESLRLVERWKRQVQKRGMDQKGRQRQATLQDTWNCS
jgi:hypothetical protein